MDNVIICVLFLSSKLHLGDVIYGAWKKGFLTGSENISKMEQLFCKLTFGIVCEFTIDLICGDSSKDDPVALTNLTAHFPAGIMAILFFLLFLFFYLERLKLAFFV